MVYRWNILEFKDNLLTLENFYNFFDDILELRRYEKNLIFSHNAESIDDIRFYLRKTKKDTQIISKKIIDEAGKNGYNTFINNLNQYQAMIEDYVSGKNIEPELLREKGRLIINFAQELLDKKKESIHKALRVSMYLPISILGCFVFLIISLFLWQAWGILIRHAFVQKTTEKLAKGDFVVQTEDIKAKNELRDLVIIFNKLAEEIDSRQEQLIQSRKMASIGTLTSGVAHELNNPLNNISLTTEILLEEYDSLPVDEAKEMIGEVISEINRASEVVRNLLDFSRGDQPSFLSLQIETVIRDTLKILKNQLMLGSIRFKSNIPKSLPIINGNKDKLTQVFLNLFLNSIQAMPNGGEMSIEVKNEPENYLRIDCKDTGIGMKPDDLEKVFDPFFTTKSVGKGTGLGLSIVYGIINKHRGYIEVKSEIDVGTTFSIFLPVAVSKDSLT